MKYLEDISIIIARLQIAKVDITVRIYSDKPLRYIMRKYPNLASLVINGPLGISLHNRFWIDGFLLAYHEVDVKLTFEALLEFLYYLDKIQKFGFNRIYIDNHLLSKVLTDYWSSRLEIENHLIIIFDDRDAKLEYSDENMMVFMYNKDGPNLIKTLIEYGSNNFLAPLETMKACGHHFKKLQFSAERYERNPEYAEVDQGYFIEDILKHCSKLERLELQLFDSLEPWDRNNFTNNRSITHPVLDSCCMSKAFLGELTSRLPKLLILHLDDCEFNDMEQYWEYDICMQDTYLGLLILDLYVDYNDDFGVVYIYQIDKTE